MAALRFAKPDVFISHSSEDSAVARELCDLIEQHGLACWIAPRDIAPGSHYGEEILGAIEDTRVTVVILSEHANRSLHVRNEIERAFSKGKPVLPVRIRNVIPSRSLELYLSAAQWVDAWSPPLVQKAAEIVAALRALMPERAPAASRPNASIGVLALGGGAIRATAGLAGFSQAGLRLIAAHSYLPTLERSAFPVRVQLGRKLLGGGNAAGDPRIGRAAAEEAETDLLQAVESLDLAFIVSCLGGGTGTGGAPFVGSLARRLGALTIGIVTTPFPMEGTRRIQVAADGLGELTECSDSVIVIPHAGLLEPGIRMNRGYGDSDRTVTGAVRAVAELILNPRSVNIDFADVRVVFTGTGRGRVGIGAASGDDAAGAAARSAIASPFLHGATLREARSLLVNIRGGSDTTFRAVDAAARIVYDQIPEEAMVVFGDSADDTLASDGVVVTAIAMGIG